MYRLLTFTLLLLTWVFFSGFLDLFHLSLGVISCAFVTWLSSDLLFEDRSVSLFDRIKQGWGLLCYFPWLVREIILANMHILRLALDPRAAEHVQPSVVKITTQLPSDFEKFILANNGEMEKRIAKIFGRDLTSLEGGHS